ATLLGQLKTLQKKEEQLREVLLILLRATPLQAPPLPAAARPLALRPPAPMAATAPRPSPALAVAGQGQQKQPWQRSLPAEAVDARAAAAAAAAAAVAAEAAARPAALSTASAAKTVSLHEALGIPPPVKRGPPGAAVAAAVAAAARASASSFQASTYRPGQHALYRATGAAAGGIGTARSGKEPARTTGRGVGLAAARSDYERANSSPSAGSPSSPSSSSSSSSSSASCSSSKAQFHAGVQYGGVVATDASGGNAESAAERGCSPPAGEPLASNGTAEPRASQRDAEAGGSEEAEAGEGGESRRGGDLAATEVAENDEVPDPRERAGLENQGVGRREGLTPAERVGTLANASGNGALSTGVGSAVRGARGQGAPLSVQKAETRIRIKEELIEDTQDDVRRGLLCVISDKSNGLLVEGLTDAAVRAGARTAADIAVRPLLAEEREQPLLVLQRVRLEASNAVAAAVSYVLRDATPHSLLPGVSRNIVCEQLSRAWQRKFDVPRDGEFLTRTIVDQARHSRVPQTSPLGPEPRGPVRVAGTVTIGYDDSEGEDGAAALRKTPASHVDRPGVGDEAEATAAAAARQPDETRGGGAPRTKGLADGSKQPSVSQLSAAANLSAEPRVSSSSNNNNNSSSSSSNSNNNNSSSNSSMNSGRPARKRRKSAEAGGWRGRYSKDEFYLGEASSDGGDDLMQGSDPSSPGEGKGTPGAFGSGGGGGEVDEGGDSEGHLVDVGGEDDDDDDFEDDDLDDTNDEGSSGRGAARKRKAAEPWSAKKKRSPPNAWKKRCADGNCQLGASFGFLGKPAMYCSAHRDAGMVNVTHRRCEEPGCVRWLVVAD
ncbi:unnamed protein product, partial [Hapterophycus canaliculatus]